MDDLASMARLITALRPWLGHLVIVGGWAHRLHRFHSLAHPPSYLPLRTRDADVAFAPNAPLAGDIGAALEAAGFTERLMGEHTPPVTQYRLGDEDRGFYAEFLTPRVGDGLTRSGAPNVTLTKAGVTAQRLRHVDLLLACPWVIRLGTATDVPLEVPADVLLANPVSFIAQKLLIQKDRTPDKQAQDALYIHDTLDLFGAELKTLRAVWVEQVRPRLAGKIVKDLDRLRRKRFGAVSDVIRTAARMPQDRALTPDRLRAACAYGLEDIFEAG